MYGLLFHIFKFLVKALHIYLQVTSLASLSVCLPVVSIPLVPPSCVSLVPFYPNHPWPWLVLHRKQMLKALA